MKHYYSNKTLLLLIACVSIFFSQTSLAQFRYTFSASTQSYAPITNGTSVSVTAGVDDEVFQSITIPFNFVYDGVVYTQITPNSNGVLFLGGIGGTAYSSFDFFSETSSLTMPVLQALFPFSADLSAGNDSLGASIQYTTVGVAPDRKFIIQLSNFQPLASSNSGTSMNAQVVLYETTNVVEFVYGSWISTDASMLLTVGLRSNGTNIFTLGNSTSVSNTDTTEWRNATRNTNSTPALTYNETVFPRSGLTYTFTPLPPSSFGDVSVVAVYEPGSTNLCDNGEYYFPFIVRNVGLATVTGANYNVSVIDQSNDSVMSSLVIAGNRPLDYLQSDTIFAGPILLGSTGGYNVLVSSAYPSDTVASNDTARTTLDITLNCSRLPYTLTPNLSGSYTPLVNGTVFNTTESDDDVLDVQLPRPFWYNGNFYNSVSISTNGFIAFGESIPSGTTNPINIANTVSAFGSNLIAPAGGITYGVRANSFVIQYTGMNQFIIDPQDLALMNFQIILNDDYSIDLVYGGISYSTSNYPRSSGLVGNLGLVGSTSSSFSTLINYNSEPNWNALVYSYGTNFGVYFDPTFTIPSGQTFSWIPSGILSTDLKLADVSVASTSCEGSVLQPLAVITNNGLTPVTAATITVSLNNGVGGSGAIRTVNYAPTTALTTGYSDTVSLGNVLFSEAGMQNLVVNVAMNGDLDTINNTIVKRVMVNTASILPYNDSLVCRGSRKVVKFAGFSGMQYYSDASMSLLLGTDSLVYPSLTRDTAFYGVPPAQADNVRGGILRAPDTLVPNTVTNTGLVFSVNRPTSLLSTDIYPITGDGTTITVQLFDFFNNSLVATAQYSIDGTRLNQAQTISFTGFDLQPFRYYQLLVSDLGSTGASLHSDATNPQSYPLTIGSIGNVVGGWNGGFDRNYFNFYNLQFPGERPCLQSKLYHLQVGNSTTDVPVITSSIIGDTICPSDTVTLTAPANGVHYRWSNGMATREIRVANTDSYSVQVAIAGGCFSSSSLPRSIVVNTAPPAPFIYSDGTSNICGQGSVRLRAFTRVAFPVRYLWSNGDTTDSLVTTVSGIFTVRMQYVSGGCYSLPSDPFRVNIGDAPAPTTISSMGSLSICPGDSVVLSSADVAPFYLWSNGETTQSIIVRSTGSYSVQLGSSFSCLSTPSNTVEILQGASPAMPTISASGSTTFCSGTGSVVLTSSQAGRYLWSTGDTSRSITVSAIGTYSVRNYFAGSTCSSLPASIVIRNGVFSAPIITSTGGTAVCEGGTLTLSVPIASGYIWSTGATTRTISVTAAGSYTVQVVSALGCTSAVSNPINITTSPIPNRVNIVANGNTSFCTGGLLQLVAPAGSSVYQWYRGATLVGNSASYIAGASGTYYVRVGNGSCFSLNSDSITVSVNVLPASPTVNVSGSTNLCSGDSVLLTATGTPRVVWSNGDTTRSIRVNRTGSYSVIGISASGCSSSASAAVQITVGTRPATPVLSRSADTLLADNGIANGNIFRWYRNGSLYTTTSIARLNIGSITGLNRYTVIASNGSCASDSSNSITVTSIAGNKASELSIYPTPATNSVHLFMNRISGNRLLIRVMDAIGKIVLAKELDVNGTLDSDLDISMLPAGRYELFIQSDNAVVMKPLIKR